MPKKKASKGTPLPRRIEDLDTRLLLRMIAAELMEQGFITAVADNTCRKCGVVDGSTESHQVCPDFENEAMVPLEGYLTHTWR